MTRTVPVAATRSGVAGLVAGALACAGVVVGAYAVFVRTPTGQWLDQQSLRRPELGQQIDEDLGGPTERVLSAFGDPLTLAAIVAVVLLVAVVGRRWWAGVAGLIAAAVAVGLARLIKGLADRPDFDVPGSTIHNSFPSGHVTAATGLLLALVFASPPRARAWVALLGGPAVALVAVGTIISGWHRVSDVVGGVFLAGATALLAAAIRGRG